MSPAATRSTGQSRPCNQSDREWLAEPRRAAALIDLSRYFADEGLSTYTHVTDQHTTFGKDIEEAQRSRVER